MDKAKNIRIITKVEEIINIIQYILFNRSIYFIDESNSFLFIS